jgi:CheY-like chemotaxis protein
MSVALVVDDSMLIRHTICRFLEERGFTVESATNGLEALSIVERIHPDIVITDMQMPKMTGPELIAALKESPATAEIPIVVVASRQCGANNQEKRAHFHIYKDIDIDEQLTKALSAIFGKPMAQGKAATK